MQLTFRLLYVVSEYKGTFKNIYIHMQSHQKAPLKVNVRYLVLFLMRIPFIYVQINGFTNIN